MGRSFATAWVANVDRSHGPLYLAVANAIAVWNQNWIEPDTAIDKNVYETIRLTIANTIIRASESCRLQPQGGPRLMYLPVNGTTTVIALGSGEWTCSNWLTVRSLR